MRSVPERIGRYPGVPSCLRHVLSNSRHHGHRLAGPRWPRARASAGFAAGCRWAQRPRAPSAPSASANPSPTMTSVSSSPKQRPDGATGAVQPSACRLRRYRSSVNTAEVAWLAWAKAAMPLWFRMLKRVRLADSSAMFASRIRLSAALMFTDCDCASEMA